MNIPAFSTDEGDAPFLIPLSLLAATTSTLAIWALVQVRYPGTDLMLAGIMFISLVALHLGLLLTSDAVDEAISSIPLQTRAGGITAAFLLALIYGSLSPSGWVVGLLGLVTLMIILAVDAAGFARLYMATIAAVILARTFSPFMIPVWYVPVYCTVLAMTMAIETAYHQSVSRRLVHPNRFYKIVLSAGWRLLLALLLPSAALAVTMVYFDPTGSIGTPHTSPPKEIRPVQFPVLDWGLVLKAALFLFPAFALVFYLRKKLKGGASRAPDPEEQTLMWAATQPASAAPVSRKNTDSARYELIRMYYNWAEDWDRLPRETPSEFENTLRAHGYDTDAATLTSRFEQVRFGASDISKDDVREFKAMVKEVDDQLRSQAHNLQDS